MQTIDLMRLRLSSQDSLLDVGCGRGRHAHAAQRFGCGEVLAIDIGEEDIAATQEGFDGDNGRAVVGDATNLPCPDESFERVICSEVLEHIPDYRAAIAEIARVVKTGGSVGISVPHFWTERICWWLARDYAYTPGGHIRIFTARDLVEDFDSFGLRLYGTGKAHGLHTPYWWLRCLLGVAREGFLVRAYKHLLEIEIMRNPRWLRALSWLADRLCAKSVVLYFVKE